MFNIKMFVCLAVATVLFTQCKKDTVTNNSNEVVCSTIQYISSQKSLSFTYDSLSGNLVQVISTQQGGTPITYNISYSGNNVSFSVDSQIVIELVLNSDGYPIEGIYHNDTVQTWNVTAEYNSNNKLTSLIRTEFVYGLTTDIDTIRSLAYSDGNLVGFTHAHSGLYSTDYFEASAVVSYTDIAYNGYYPLDKLCVMRDMFRSIFSNREEDLFFSPQVFSTDLISSIIYTEVRKGQYYYSPYHRYFDDTISYSYQSNAEGGISGITYTVNNRSSADTTMRETHTYNFAVSQTCN